MGPDRAECEDRSAEIQNELSDSDLLVGELIFQVERLASRLEPILENNPKTVGESASKGSVPSRSTIIGQRIADNNARLSGLIDTISDLKSRAAV